MGRTNGYNDFLCSSLHDQSQLHEPAGKNARSTGRDATGPCSLREDSMAEPHQEALGDIEKRLRKLVAKYQQLQVENQSLRESQANLTAEKAHLINQNEQARLRVEAMIGRLKTLERHS